MQVAKTAVIVREYDEAIAFYTGTLGLPLVEDTDLGDGKRWVVVGGLVLARAVTAAQLERVGNQTGNRVFLFVETDDFERDHRRLVAAGVRFIEPPRREKYGMVAVFLDLYGNKLDLIGA